MKYAWARSLYLYLVSIIALMFIIVNGALLLSMALKNWVLIDAASYESAQRSGPPPSFFPFASDDKSTAVPSACTDNCTFSDAQKIQAQEWLRQYQSWKDISSNAVGQRQQEAARALSFLLVAVPVFLYHWMLARRDQRKREQEGDTASSSSGKRFQWIRTVYFYLVSLISLIMMIVSAALLMNVVLKNWVFPEAGKVEQAQRTSAAKPVTVIGEQSIDDTTGVARIASCADACAFSAEIKDAASSSWPRDYDEWQVQSTNAAGQRGLDLVQSLAFLLVALPVFGYHWYVVRRESKKGKEEGAPAV